MRQTLITLLLLVTLLSQWGLIEHGYHSHDPGEVCEVCVSASGHVAITASAAQLPESQGVEFIAPALSSPLTAATPRYYATRAPPLFL